MDDRILKALLILVAAAGGAGAGMRWPNWFRPSAQVHAPRELVVQAREAMRTLRLFALPVPRAPRMAIPFERKAEEARVLAAAARGRSTAEAASPPPDRLLVAAEQEIAEPPTRTLAFAAAPAQPEARPAERERPRQARDVRARELPEAPAVRGAAVRYGVSDRGQLMVRGAGPVYNLAADLARRNALGAAAVPHEPLMQAAGGLAR